MKKGWKFEILDIAESDLKGYKVGQPHLFDKNYLYIWGQEKLFSF